MIARQPEPMTSFSDSKGMTNMSTAARIYVSARDELDFADAVDALRASGYTFDLEDVYLPADEPRADVAALCSSGLVVHTHAEDERTATDMIVSITAYGLRIPEVYVGDLLDAA